MWVWKGTPHTEEKLTEKQFKEILSIGGFGVRNTFEFDCKEITKFWYIIKDKYSELSDYSGNTRSRIRKSQDAFSISRISREMMKEEGYRVYLDAFKQYKVKEGKLSKEQFASLMDVPEYEFWGCIYKETGKLEAYMICRQIGDYCQRVASKTNPDYLPKYFPMYGLNHIVQEHYLKERALRYITNGSRSITEHSNIQNFLIEKFNYRKAYCHLKIYYKWYMKIAVAILYPIHKYIPSRSIRSFLEMHGMQG